MRILVDLDAVCCDTNGAILRWYNSTYDDCSTYEDMYDFMAYKACPKARPADVKAHFDSDGFFADLSPMPFCSEVLERLHWANHEIVVVTSVPKQSRTGLFDKRQWVLNHLPFLPANNLVATHRKELVLGDILLDDGPLNLQPFPELTCAFDYPYNRFVKTDYRVRNWLEFEEIIISLEKVY